MSLSQKIKELMEVFEGQGAGVPRAVHFFFLPKAKDVVFRALAKANRSKVHYEFDQRVVSVANRERLAAKWKDSHPNWVLEMNKLDDMANLFGYVLSLANIITSLQGFLLPVFDVRHPVVREAYDRKLFIGQPNMTATRDRIRNKMEETLVIANEWADNLLFMLGMSGQFGSGSERFEKKKQKKQEARQSPIRSPMTSPISSGGLLQKKRLGSPFLDRLQKGLSMSPTGQTQGADQQDPVSAPSAAATPATPPRSPPRAAAMTETVCPPDYYARPLPNLRQRGRSTFDPKMVAWHRKVLRLIDDFPDTPQFSHLPTYDEFFRATFDYKFTTEQKIPNFLTRDLDIAHWERTHPAWAREIKRVMADKEAKKAYLRRLVLLMSQLQRDIHFILDNPSGHWRVGRMAVRPQHFGVLRRDPVYAVDIMINDFNLIGELGVKWAGH